MDGIKYAVGCPGGAAHCLHAVQALFLQNLILQGRDRGTANVRSFICACQLQIQDPVSRHGYFRSDSAAVAFTLTGSRHNLFSVGCIFQAGLFQRIISRIRNRHQSYCCNGHNSKSN